MCKWGTESTLEVTIPANLSFTGEERRAVKGIDSCIAEIVKALNDGGVKTVSSCCGHGRHRGVISLADGRELLIQQSEEARNERDKIPLEVSGG